MPKKNIVAVHAQWIDKKGWPVSVSFDEEEFNDGSIDFNDSIAGIIAEGGIKIRLEIEVEE